MDLEKDRQEYFNRKEAAAADQVKQEKQPKKGGWFSKPSKEEKTEKQTVAKQEQTLEMDYVPVDFDAYSIRD